MGAADGARHRARALRSARHALPEKTRARYTAQIALRQCRDDDDDDDGNGNDNDDGNDDGNVDGNGDHDGEHEDRRANGDHRRRHAEGRENATTRAPSARDWRSHDDARSTPGRGAQEKEVHDRTDHSRTTPCREKTAYDHRLHEESQARSKRHHKEHDRTAREDHSQRGSDTQLKAFSFLTRTLPVFLHLVRTQRETVPEMGNCIVV